MKTTKTTKTAKTTAIKAAATNKRSKKTEAEAEVKTAAKAETKKTAKAAAANKRSNMAETEVKTAAKTRKAVSKQPVEAVQPAAAAECGKDIKPTSDKTSAKAARRALTLAKNDLDPYGLAPLKQQVGRNLWLVRNARQISRAKLASMLGVARSTIRSWEEGATLTTFPMLLKASEFLQIPIETLLDDAKAKEFVAALPGTVEEMHSRNSFVCEHSRSVGDRLSAILDAKGFSEEDLAEMLGVGARDLREWILGSAKISIGAIADILEVDVNALVSNESLSAELNKQIA